MEPVWLQRNIKHYNDDDIRWEDANNDNGQITERGTEAAAATTGVQWFAEQAIILPSLQSSFFLSETIPPHHFRNFGSKEVAFFALIIWTSPGWWPPSSTSRSTGPSSYSSMMPWTRSDQKFSSKKNVKNMWHPFLLPGCYILGESGRAWAPFQLDLPPIPLPFSYWTNWSPLFIIFVTSIDL